MVRFFYKKVPVTWNPLGDKNTWLYEPGAQEVVDLFAEFEKWANENNARVISVTPITAGVMARDLHAGQPFAAGMAYTCGFVIAYEQGVPIPANK